MFLLNGLDFRIFLKFRVYQLQLRPAKKQHLGGKLRISKTRFGVNFEFSSSITGSDKKLINKSIVGKAVCYLKPDHHELGRTKQPSTTNKATRLSCNCLLLFVCSELILNQVCCCCLPVGNFLSPLTARGFNQFNSPLYFSLGFYLSIHRVAFGNTKSTEGLSVFNFPE